MSKSKDSVINPLPLGLGKLLTMRKSNSPYSLAFRKRRAINWLTLGFTYSAMYMGRYNLSFANKALSQNYGWDKTQIGAIITAGLSIYGFSAIFNGPIADKIGGRNAMLIGAVGTVVFNFAFGLAPISASWERAPSFSATSPRFGR